MVEAVVGTTFSIPTEQKRYENQAEIDAVLAEHKVVFDAVNVHTISLGGNSFGKAACEHLASLFSS